MKAREKIHVFFLFQNLPKTKMSTIKTAYTQVSSNKFKTWLIMFLFTLFIAVVAYVFTYALGYSQTEAFGFITIFLILALIMNFASFYFSDSIILAISQAHQITKNEAPELFRVVENLSIATGLPMPRVYIIEDSATNAFATGRDPGHSALVFTTGILQKLNRLELEGVAAHELSHVKNYDIRVMAVVTILVGLVALLADMFFRMMWWGGGRRRDDNSNGTQSIFILLAFILAILSPIIAQLIQLAVSRQREFLADASAAVLTRNPDSLADALLKISADKEPLEVANKGTAHLYIANPLKNKHGGVGWFSGLFNTHPPVEERIRRLREM